MARTATLHKVLPTLWDAVWRDRRRTQVALALLVLAKVAAVAVPLLLKAIIDGFSQPGSIVQEPGVPAPPIMVLPVFLLLGYALIRFSSTLFTELRDLVFARVTQRTVADFAARIFSHMLWMSPRFHLQRNTGSLIRDIERGTRGIGFLLGAGLFTLLPTLIEFGGVLIVMAAGYSLWFTLIIMVTFFVYAAFTTAVTEKRAVRQREVNDLDSHASGRMVDSLINYETVKTHAREAYERDRYGAVLDRWIDGSVQNQKALSTLHIGQSAIIAAGIAAVMLLAAQQTMRGVMTVGDLVLVNSYVIQICLPLNALGFVFREARDALVNTEKLFALLDQPSEIQGRAPGQPLAVRGGEVAFEQVDFGYEPGRQVLHDVSFTIPAGQTVAVVGGSGSGKSTLARLLLHLYEVQGGRVTIDGQDLKHVTLESLREAIGIVPQDTVLFNDTIAYNIGYGRAGAGMAEVIAAAQAAQVHEFVMALPEQYDTIVGERGLKLSGGEKQRIAIARAFLKNPPIVIFDEATSALDTRAERAIQGELDRIAQGRTTLIIAHRLSTIVDADQIVVLDKGRIVERGRHEELLQREGLYAQLWNLQRQQQEVERLQRRMARQPLNMAVLVAGVIDGLRDEIEARGVALYTDIETENARVVGDPSTLAQALHELCLQALQATPVHGRVELRLERDRDTVRFSVTDGRHAPGERAPAPADQTPLDPLELRSTIERQGGRFQVEAPASHRGMRYLVELPLRAEVPRAPMTAPVLRHGGLQPLEPQSLRGLAVMCIDDQADTLDSLRMLLELDGAQALTFTTGREALDWLARHEDADWPQLIVCDIALGDEDGHDVVHEIRRIEAQRGVPLERRVPAVALTGYSREGDRMRALLAGFQVHLSKPVDPRQLLATLFNLSGRAEQAATASPSLPPPEPSA